MYSNIMIFAHRGAAHFFPENTIPAFQKAIHLGANGIELDVQLTKDGHPVVIHDEKVNRTTNGKGLVKHFTLKELQQLNVGAGSLYTPIKIPTLEQVLKNAVRYPVLLNIEMKNLFIRYDGIEKRIVQLIQKYELKRRVILSSFNSESLEIVKRLDDQITTGFLYFGKLDEPWLIASQLGARAIHPPINALTSHFVKRCHSHGLIVCPYHINRRAQIQLALNSGVDGVITKHPEKVREFVE